MNKAIMISIHKKWLDMIIDGTKKIEFRSYSIPKNTKVYLRETKADGGSGQVRAEFVVGECIDVFNDLFPNLSGDASLQNWDNQGYTNQKYAMSIEQLIVYDAEWNKTQESMLDTNDDGEPIEWKLAHKLYHAPTKPIPVTEFVSWNKLQEKIKNHYGVDENNCDGLEDLYIDVLYEQKDFLDETLERYKKFGDVYLPQEYLTKPPQGKVYVVEKEF